MCQRIFKSIPNCSGVNRERADLKFFWCPVIFSWWNKRRRKRRRQLPLIHQALSTGLALRSELYVQKSYEFFLQHFEEDIISPMYSHLPKVMELVSGAAGTETQVTMIKQP